MDENVTRREYEEYQKRIDDEENRQNHRLDIVEEQTKQINALTVSIEKLTQSIKVMAETQEAQGKKLEVLDGRDGEKWRSVVMCVITTAIGIAVGYLFKAVIL